MFAIIDSKKAIFLFILLFQFELLYSNANWGEIFGDNINLRSGPTLNDDIIDVLDNQTKIKILKSNLSEKNFFIGKYLGDWDQVSANGRTGFVFNAFIKSSLHPEEKFHVFLKRYFPIYKKTSVEKFNRRVRLPLRVEMPASDVGEVDKVIWVNKQKLNEYLTRGTDLDTGKNLEFNYKNGFVSVVDYEPESDYIVIYIFELIDNKWFLKKLIV
ncbi:MAG: SH3 domain-containing protein [Leptospirales bacterium]